MQRIGLLAVQGDFDRHRRAFLATGVSLDNLVEVRTTDDLTTVDRLVIPGGESTTVGLLLQRFGLGDAIRQRAADGMPVWGTCMGMILMAKAVKDREQYTLDLLDITVERNAFGAQVHSFEDAVQFADFDSPVTGVFIRAPIVIESGPDVEVLSTYNDAIVAVRQGSRLGTSFHPELTRDTRIHEWFLTL